MQRAFSAVLFSCFNEKMPSSCDKTAAPALAAAMLAAASLSSSMVFRGSLQRLSSQLRGTLIVYGMSRLKTAVIGTGRVEMSEISDSKSRLHCEVRQKEVGTKTLLLRGAIR